MRQQQGMAPAQLKLKTLNDNPYDTATRCSLREIKSARDAIKSREDEVLNYFINHSTNAGAESLNSKIKSFRSQLRGVSDYDFFMYRLYKIFG